LGTSINDTILQAIAIKTGGVFYLAPTSNDLLSIYQSISEVLNNQYIVTYNRNPLDINEKELKIEVSTVSKAGQDITSFKCSNANLDTDGDGIPDSIEDADHDGYVDADETDPNDADTDDDGLSDGDEVNTYSSNPLELDTDGDGLQDGTEVGETTGTADTDGGIFIPDADGGATTTDPLDDDSDNDGLLDGEEDANHNGVVDGDETDPNVSNRSTAMPWIPLLLLGD
jgi:hypothetical protein